MNHGMRERHLMLESLLGVPAFAGTAALLWWQWPNVHYWAIRSFLFADRLLALPFLPLAVSYALLGALATLTVALFKHDGRLIEGPLRWRALIIPLLAAGAYWLLKG